MPRPRRKDHRFSMIFSPDIASWFYRNHITLLDDLTYLNQPVDLHANPLSWPMVVKDSASNLRDRHGPRLLQPSKDSVLVSRSPREDESRGILAVIPYPFGSVEVLRFDCVVAIEQA